MLLSSTRKAERGRAARKEEESSNNCGQSQAVQPQFPPNARERDVF